MKKFKTIQRLKTVPQEEIAAEIGKSKAEKLVNYFNAGTMETMRNDIELK